MDKIAISGGSNEPDLLLLNMIYGHPKGRACKICSMQKTHESIYTRITSKLLNKGGESIAKFTKAINKEYGADITEMNISRHKKHMWDVAFVNGELLIKKKTKKKTPNGMGTVYFIKSGEYHKIGMTTDFKQRMKYYKTHNPLEIEVVFMRNLKNCMHHERKLHRMLKSKLKHGGWFLLNKDDVEQTISYLKDC